MWGTRRGDPAPSEIVAPGPQGDAMDFVTANFREFFFRDRPKRVCWVVIRYSSMYEKALPNRPLRRRMGLHRASPAYPNSPRTASGALPT